MCVSLARVAPVARAKLGTAIDPLPARADKSGMMAVPAIYGLTEEPYVVFTANAFALMGLRQLFFLIGGLLDRLVYLSYGLSAILAFIGVKLVLHALHENTLPFINGGEHVTVPVISTPASLGVILGILIIATVASLITTRGSARVDASE